MSYTIAAIDVHKRILMVALATTAEQVEDPVGEALASVLEPVRERGSI